MIGQELTSLFSDWWKATSLIYELDHFKMSEPQNLATGLLSNCFLFLEFEDQATILSKSLIEFSRNGHNS